MPKLYTNRSTLSVIVRIISCLLFILFTYTQFNDPDPVLWISIYGTIALILFISLFTPINNYILLIIACFLIVYSAILIPEIINWIKKGMPSIVETMEAGKAHIEYTREFFGILICLLTLFIIHRSDKVHQA